MDETKKDIEPTGYVVAVKVNKPNTYRFKDIAEMTNEEFQDWLFSIYPYRFTDEKQFSSRLTRIKSLEYAMAFWQKPLLVERK